VRGPGLRASIVKVRSCCSASLKLDLVLSALTRPGPGATRSGWRVPRYWRESLMPLASASASGSPAKVVTSLPAPGLPPAVRLERQLRGSVGSGLPIGSIRTSEEPSPSADSGHAGQNGKDTDFHRRTRATSPAAWGLGTGRKTSAIQPGGSNQNVGFRTGGAWERSLIRVPFDFGAHGVAVFVVDIEIEV